MELSAKGNNYLYTPIKGGSSARKVSNGALNRFISIVFWPAVVLAFLILGLSLMDSYSSSLVPSTDSRTKTPALPAVSASDNGATEASGAVSEGASSGSASNEAKANITVNGQSIEVPANGSVNETITSGNGSTSVSAQSSNTQQSSDGSSSTRSNLRIKVKSNSDSSNVRLNVNN